MLHILNTYYIQLTKKNGCTVQTHSFSLVPVLFGVESKPSKQSTPPTSELT